MGGIAPARPEIWAGPECAFLRVDGSLRDELALTGHHRRDDDIDRLASLGVKAVRYPVLWGRSSDPGEDTDWAWARARLGRLAELGIEPVVGLLHHGFGPAGRLPTDPGWPKAFGRYAGEVARRFPEIRRFIPINEPLTTARFGGLYGWWEPHGHSQAAFAGLLLAQVEGIVAATRAIRAVRPDAEIIVNEDIGRTYGTRRCADEVRHDNDRRWLTFDLLAGAVGAHHPMWGSLALSQSLVARLSRLIADPAPPDVIGVDHYVTSDRYLDHRLEWFPTSSHGGNGRLAYADVELVRVGGYAVRGLARAVQETWERYHRPIALTEVQLAGADDDQVAWWAEALAVAEDAVSRGVDLTAITAWATFGAYDWDTLLRLPRGAYEGGAYAVAADGAPHRTPLGDAVTAAAAGKGIPVLRPGWWRTRERVLYRPRDRRRQPRTPGRQHPFTVTTSSSARPSRQGRELLDRVAIDRR